MMEVPEDDPAARDEVMRAARLRMQIISLGRSHWAEHRA
jgi:hypothetical protein